VISLLSIGDTRCPLSFSSILFQSIFQLIGRRTKKAYESQSDSLDYALGYARVLMILKNFPEAKEVLLPFFKKKIENYALFYFLGKASHEEGELAEAISFYQRALNRKGNVVEILNAIGECWFLLGEEKEALRAWEKSLGINPEQEKIKRLIQAIKK
jgi:tetratricopeptide (TPR) repeat protein